MGNLFTRAFVRYSWLALDKQTFYTSTHIITIAPSIWGSAGRDHSLEISSPCMFFSPCNIEAMTMWYRVFVKCVKCIEMTQHNTTKMT